MDARTWEAASARRAPCRRAARRSFEQALRHDPGYRAARMAIEYLDATIGKPL